MAVQIHGLGLAHRTEVDRVDAVGSGRDNLKGKCVSQVRKTRISKQGSAYWWCLVPKETPVDFGEPPVGLDLASTALAAQALRLVFG